MYGVVKLPVELILGSERQKISDLAPRHGRFLGPLWANQAKILHGRGARVWLRMMQISLGWVELRRRSDQKPEKVSKTDNFRCFWPGLPDSAADCSAPEGRSSQNFTW